jgi:hypothetical protein
MLSILNQFLGLIWEILQKDVMYLASLLVNSKLNDFPAEMMESFEHPFEKKCHSSRPHPVAYIFYH